MKRFLAVYTLFALGIAAYAWQTTPQRLHDATAVTPAPTFDDYAWLASVTVLKALPALLGLLLCASIAARIWERLRYAQANAAGLLPIPRRYIEETPELAVEALAAYHGTERARAEHQTPERFTYAPHLRFAGPAAAPALEVEHTPAGAPTFAELLSRGLVGTGQPLILGYSAGQPLTGSWRDLYSSAVAGVSGSGKTSTCRFLACQAALSGARFAIIDPHGDVSEESLAATLEPLHAAFVATPAIDERAMLDTIRLMQARLHARLHGDGDRSPLIVAIDEFTTLARLPTVAAPLAELVESIGQQGRKVALYCLLAGHIWTGSRTQGTPVRDSLASVYCHRLKRQQARLLLDTETARLAEALQPGRALLLRTNGECRPVAIPLATPADVESVGYQLATTRLPNESARLPDADGAVATDTQATSASGRPPAVSAEARQAADLFLAGNDPAAIVLQLRGIRSDQGRRYQTALGEVLELVRIGVKAAQERV